MNVWKVEGIRRDAKQTQPKASPIVSIFWKSTLPLSSTWRLSNVSAENLSHQQPTSLDHTRTKQERQRKPRAGDTAHLTQRVTAERHGLPWQYHGLKLGSILDSGHWKWQQNELTHTHTQYSWLARYAHLRPQGFRRTARDRNVLQTAKLSAPALMFGVMRLGVVPEMMLRAGNQGEGLMEKYGEIQNIRIFYGSHWKPLSKPIGWCYLLLRYYILHDATSIYGWILGLCVTILHCEHRSTIQCVILVACREGEHFKCYHSSESRTFLSRQPARMKLLLVGHVFSIPFYWQPLAVTPGLECPMLTLQSISE